MITMVTLSVNYFSTYCSRVNNWTMSWEYTQFLTCEQSPCVCIFIVYHYRTVFRVLCLPVKLLDHNVQTCSCAVYNQ